MTGSSWSDSSHAPHILITLSIPLNIFSGEGDGGVGGGEFSHHTVVDVGHSDSVVELYSIRSPWWRPGEELYTIW